MPAFLFFSPSAFAADINITIDVDLPQTYLLDNQKIVVTGDLSVDNGTLDLGAAISDSNNTGLQLEVNTASNKGVASTGGNHGAFELTGSATLSSINLISGRITSDIENAGTISLKGGGGTGSIINAGTISNSESLGYAIESDTSSNTTLSITNSGTISGGTYGIFLRDSNSGSSLSLDNSGTITGDDALSLSGFSGSITNSGTITGNVDLGTSSTTSLTLTDGILTGDVTIGHANQVVNFSGGDMEGTIEGSSANMGVVNFNEDYLFGTALNLGGTNGLATLNVSLGKTITAGASIKAQNVNLSGHLNLFDAMTITGNANIGEFGLLVLNNGSSITGTINGTSDGLGTLHIGASGDVTLQSNIGATHNLADVVIFQNATLDAATNNNTIKSTFVTIKDTGTLELGTGAVTGTIRGFTDGVGTLSITDDLTSNGSLGISTNSLAQISVTAGKTLDLATNNNSFDATNVSLGSSSSILLGTGTAVGTIDGSSSNNGIVSFNVSRTFGSELVLGSNNGLEQVNIASGALVTANSSIKSSAVNVNGQLNLGSSKSITGNVVIADMGLLVLNNNSAVNGTINGNSTGTEVLHIAASSSVTTNGNIGASNALSDVVVFDNATLDAATNNNSITTFYVKLLGDNALLNLGTGAVNGTIISGTSGQGTVNFTQDQTMGGNAGTSDFGLKAINISANKTITAGSYELNASSVNLASGSKLSLGSGALRGAVEGTTSGVGTLSFTQNYSTNGTIGATNKLSTIEIGTSTVVSNHSMRANNITIGSGGKLTHSGGTLSGAINGVSSNQGTLEINSNFSSDAAIGATNALSAINILSGKTMSLGADVSANDISVAGILNLGNSSRTITGDVSASGSGTINAGSASHIVTGDLALNSGDNFEVALNGISAGKITAQGAASNNASTNLDIDFSAAGYIANGSTYTILSGGSGSSIADINDGNISVNGGTNRFGRFTFTTIQSGNDLMIKAQRDAWRGGSGRAQEIHGIIDDIGVSATGNMRSMQIYLDSQTNDQTIESALQTTTPQLDNSLIRNSVNTTTTSLNVAEERLRMDYLGKGIASGDEANKYGFWIQPFGANVRQGEQETNDGYRLNMLGGALGFDKEVFDDSRVGFSLSYAKSNIKSLNRLKKVDVDTYQATIYSGYNLGNFFLNGLAGFAWNEYDSNRAMPAISANAKANYDGQTYVARARSGYAITFKEKFQFIPEAMLTFVHNAVDGYTETGAGTMDLNVSRDNSNFLEARVGAGLGYWHTTSRGTKINPEARLSYGYDFIQDRQSTSANFVGQTAVFTAQAAKVDPTSLRAHAALNIFKINDITLTAEYIFEMKENYRGHYGMLRSKWGF